MIKSSLKLMIGAMALLYFTIINATNVAGQWQNIDDETGEKKAVVEIKQTSTGELMGKIIRLNQKPGSLCTECSGNLKDKPIEGMTIMWGLMPDGENSWSGGEILDPSNGKTYKLKATLSADGQTLELRGYIGVSLIGRTQTWQKIQ